jgi:hypothetical protein
MCGVFSHQSYAGVLAGKSGDFSNLILMPAPKSKCNVWNPIIRGWNVRAFDDFENALAWLAGGKSGELSESVAAKKRSKALPVPLAQQPARPSGVRLRVRRQE